MSSNAMNKLLAAANKAKTGGSDREDENFYYPARDTLGNGSAVIRFLPSEDEDNAPFVKLFSHGFKGPTGKWFFENCPTTLERDCPMCTASSKLWATNLDANKEIVRNRKRKISYVSRILVVEDKKNPENEGKVFLYKYGQKVFDKWLDKLQPAFEDEKACNVFDLNTGANFKLKIRKVENQTTYDKSEFDTPSKCDVNVAAQYSAENNIQKFLNPENFKTEEALLKRMDLVLGNTYRVAPAAPAAPAARRHNEPVKAESSRVEVKKIESDDDDDGVMALVKQLAGDDDIPF